MLVSKVTKEVVFILFSKTAVSVVEGCSEGERTSCLSQ